MARVLQSVQHGWLHASCHPIIFGNPLRLPLGEIGQRLAQGQVFLRISAGIAH